MSFGSPTPVELVIHGPNLRDDLAYARKVRAELEKVPAVRDLQFGQAQDFPTVEVTMDRERAGLSQVTVQEMSRALLSATSSSRYVVLNYWADLASGNGYQVQVQVPPPRLDSAQEIGVIPVKQTPSNQVLLRDVARVREGARPGEYDRLDMRRYISLTANIEGSDLGRVATAIDQALDRAGPPPRGVRVDVRGQIEPMRQMFGGLAVGLVLVGGVHLPAADGLLPVAEAGTGGRGGGPGGPGRRRGHALHHGDDAQYPVVHGRDHGGRGGRGERHPAGDLRGAGPPSRTRRSPRWRPGPRSKGRGTASGRS